MRQRLLAVLIAILPVAYIYAFPILINNLGHALLLFIIFPILLVDYSEKRKNQRLIQKQKAPFNKPYILFSFYLLFISLISPLVNSFEGNFKELLSAAEFSVIVFFLINDKKIAQPFVDIYTKIAVIFAIFLIIQYVAFIFMGMTISGAIPFLDVYNREVESISEGRILRICSVFAEPSHFSVYEVPALLMYLFGKTHQKGRIVKIVIITISILLSTSSNGIIVMGVVYAAFIVSRVLSRINIWYIALGVLIFVGAFYFISRSEFINDVTYGLFVQEADMTTSKAELRIYRGFNLYADLSAESKLFGVGWRNAQNYCRTCEPALFSNYSTDVFDYFNSIAGTLIYSGFIGFLLLFAFFFNMFKCTSDFGTRTLVISVFVLMGSSSILMSDQWILFLATIISLINISKNAESNRHLVTQSYGDKE